MPELFLQGVRVLDLTRLLPGGYASLLLADMGAEVIKVEDPRGGALDSLTPALSVLDRNKKSITLDLRQPRGRELCLKLAAEADVVLESFRPGVATALGIGYEQVRALNPRVVYTSITGWGQTGPLARLAAHDINYMSVAGALGLTGLRDGQPVIPGVQVADLSVGLMAALSTVSALRRVAGGGTGAYIDAAMFDVVASWLALPAALYWNGLGPTPERGAYALNGGFVCYNLYQTSDGEWMALGALEPKFWANFCRAVERPDLLDKAYAPAVAEEPAFAEVSALFRRRTREEWTELGRAADCCLTPVLHLPEALTSSQMQARGMVCSDANGRPTDLAHPATTSDGRRGRGPGPIPRAGQDTVSVLSALGVTAEELEELQRSGVIGTPEAG